MNKTHENPNSSSAGAAGSAFWLQHKAGGKNGRFILTKIGAEVQTLLDTGSSVQVLRALKRHRLTIPEIMAGTGCWEKEWACRW